MNDFDFEEKQLLSSLHHRHIQPLNLPGPNDYFNTGYHNEHHQYTDDRNHRQYTNKQYHRMGPSYTNTDNNNNNNNNNNLATTVSMSTEDDLLDNFELDFEGDQTEIVDSIHNSNITTDIDIEHTETATVVSLRSSGIKMEENSVFTPELPRNISLDTQQVSAAATTIAKLKQRKQRKPSPSRSGKTNDTKNDDNTPSARVAIPKSEDILCGQSRICASHPGNQTFQRVLGDYAHTYDIATSKQEKMHMTKAIVLTIHDSGGRFLKFREGMWEEISTVAARDKVSHALRTKVNSWKRQHKQLLKKDSDPFAPPKRTSLSRHCRKRSIRDSSSSPVPFDERQQESSKFSDLLRSQQTNFANMTTTPEERKSGHHVRHSYGGEFYQSNHHHYNNSHHCHHSRRSSSRSF